MILEATKAIRLIALAATISVTKVDAAKPNGAGPALEEGRPIS